MRHFDIVGPEAIHQIAFSQDDDPALDPDNEVTADLFWLDTSGAPIMKFRNSDNTLWVPLGF